jgi:hypothetical protein
MFEKSKLVTTVDGTSHPRKACRRISGEYYLIGDPKVKDSGHCYKIDDRYYKYNTNYIVYDHTLSKYVRKNSSLFKVILNIDEDGNLEEGFASIPKGLISDDYPRLIKDDTI